MGSNESMGGCAAHSLDPTGCTHFALRETGDANHAHDRLAVDVVQPRAQPMHLLAGLRHAVPHVLFVASSRLGRLWLEIEGGTNESKEKTTNLEGGKCLEEVL